MWRGFQSAVFLYAQCGPCLAWRESHRQKKQWKREKQERARYSDQPGVLRQPAPHEVNPSWEEEIRLGPAPPPKKGRKRANTRNSRDTASSGTLVPSETAGEGMDDLRGDSKERPMFWNAKRFQRPDEEYTYVDPPEERPQMVYAPPGLIRRGSSVGVGAWTVDGPKSPGKPKRTYTPTASMPPVNELHPPVVSSVPAKKEDRAWMTAAPPSAAFMRGTKGTTTRPRSGSGNSSMKSADTHLNRQVGQKIVEEKIKKGEHPEDDIELRPSSRSVPDPLSLEPPVVKERSNSTSPFRLVREKTPPSPMRPRSRRPAPLRLNSDKSARTASTKKASGTDSEMSSSSDASISHRGRAKPTYQSITKTRTNARSALNSHPISPPAGNQAEAAESTTSLASTKFSPTSTLQQSKDGVAETPLTASPRAVDNYTPSPRKRRDAKMDGVQSPLLVKDSSLHVLQDVVDPNTLLNSKFVQSPVIEARVPLPPGDSPRKENASPLGQSHRSAKQQLLLEEGARRWSWGV